MIGLLLGLGIASARAQPTGLAVPGFDKPLAEQTVALPATRDGTPVTLHCVTYPGFVVREIHEGDDIGMESVRLAPGDSGCAPAAVAGERALDDQGMQWFGAVGQYVLLMWPDGANDGTEFAVFDAKTAMKLHTDVMRNVGSELKSASLTADRQGLELRFTRVVSGQCSLLATGMTCWSQFASDPMVPAVVGHRPPPLAACSETYRRARLLTPQQRQDPSVVAFAVTLRIVPGRPVTVRDVGGTLCWPAE